jgi:hypothetical protein
MVFESTTWHTHGCLDFSKQTQNEKNEVFSHRPMINNGQFYLTLLQMGKKKV